MTAVTRRTTAAAERRGGKKKRGDIDRSVMKEKEGDDYDNADSWDEHNFDVGGKG